MELRHASAAPIAPTLLDDVDVYPVLNDFGGKLGRAWSETDEERTDREMVIAAIFQPASRDSLIGIAAAGRCSCRCRYGARLRFAISGRNFYLSAYVEAFPDRADAPLREALAPLRSRGRRAQASQGAQARASEVRPCLEGFWCTILSSGV